MTDTDVAAGVTPANPPLILEPGPSVPTATGWILILAGVGLVAMAFLYDVGVNVGSGGLYGLPERVANSDKMAFRSMILATGLTSFVSGWIALSCGLILEALDRK